MGSSNEFSFNVCKGVAKNPASSTTPPHLRGTGLGKTHLLNAIGNESIRQERVVIYVTSEQFLNDFLYHIRNHTMDRFRENTATATSSSSTTCSFSAETTDPGGVFSHLQRTAQQKKQIVLTSDKPPKQIAGLEERLKSRFEWGC